MYLNRMIKLNYVNLKILAVKSYHLRLEFKIYMIYMFFYVSISLTGSKYIVSVM